MSRKTGVLPGEFKEEESKGVEGIFKGEIIVIQFLIEAG